MTTITISETKINFVEKIQSWEIRKIFPYFAKIEENPIDSILTVSEYLFIDMNWEKDLKKYIDFINKLDLEDMTILTTCIWKLIEDYQNVKKKSKNS